MLKMNEGVNGWRGKSVDEVINPEKTFAETVNSENRPALKVPLSDLDNIPIEMSKNGATDAELKTFLKQYINGDVDVNKSIERIKAIRSGNIDMATIGRLPSEINSDSIPNKNIMYERRIVENKIMAGGSKNLTVAELAYSANNYTRSKIIEFEQNGKGKLNIIRPLSNGKVAIIALEKQADGNILVTTMRPKLADNYVRNLQKNKNAKVLYDTIGEAATAFTTEPNATAASTGAIADSNSIISQSGDDVNLKNKQYEIIQKPTLC